MVGATSRVLVIGAGLTGSLVAHLLERELPAGAVELHVWDKARGVGGRTSVRRSDTGGQTDLGAQYLTEVDDLPAEHARVYERLAALGVLKPMEATIAGTRAADGSGRSWVAPAGMNAVAKALLEHTGARVALGRRVLALHHADDGSGGWRVEAEGAEPAEDLRFDAVVLTTPLPQLLELGGALPAAIDAHGGGGLRAALGSAQYSTRFSLSLFWDGADEGARAFLDGLGWACRYVSRDEEPSLAFLSRCAAKRGVGAAEPPALLAHSSVPFALARTELAADDASARDELVESVRRLLPGLPAAREVRLMRWTYSQVRTPLALGAAAIGVGADAPSGRLPVVLAGDALSAYGSRFDGCLDSARAACAVLSASLRAGGSGAAGPASSSGPACAESGPGSGDARL